MKFSADYYATKLYPLQDGILRLLRESQLPFYLTGGTALSRGYFSHRYSDDLDLFLNADPLFKTQAQKLFDEIKKKYTLREPMVRESFWRLLVEQQDVALKIDLVNDVAYRLGNVVPHQTLGLIDSVENILTNKVTALFRYAPKDISDIWIICKNTRFSWSEIFNHANKKELGTEPVSGAEVLQTFPENLFDDILWTSLPDKKQFMADLRQIGHDMLRGEANSLA